MIYIELLLGFLKVGFFAFGGAYAAVPLIREVVVGAGWLSDESMSYMIAVSESTPGSLMLNLATFVGSNKAGLPGALIATFAVAFPAFIIILLVMVIFGKMLENQYIKAFIDGLKPCMSGIIIATGLFMAVELVLPIRTLLSLVLGSDEIAAQSNAISETNIDLRALLIIAIIVAAKVLYKKFKSKKLSPIVMILIGAFLGVIVY
ncbi:MAG: chromate transporter [Lachnospiraceae bacterium]|nr:chromate transporter [Lachnospiraceae bacterium]